MMPILPAATLVATGQESPKPSAVPIEDIRIQLERSTEPFIAKYRRPGEAVPVWVALETLSLGTVSKMYRLLDDEPIRERIAKSFGLKESQHFQATLHSLSILRNICAHHSRVWNRTVKLKPHVPRALVTEQPRDIYYGTPWGWLVVLSDLVDRVRGDDSYREALFGYVDEHPEWTEGLKFPHNR